MSESLEKPWTAIRLCGTCSCSNKYQYLQKVSSSNSLRLDRRCVACGEFNWTTRYVRPEPHQWFTFWTVFLGTFGACWLLYLLYCYWLVICQPFFVEYFKQWD